MLKTMRGLLVRNTLWMMGGQGLRVGVQAVYFVVIARTLGATGYGAFVGVAALVAIAAPFASWGSGNLMVRAVARDAATFPVYWGKVLLTTLMSGVLLTGLTAALARLLLPDTIPLSLVVLVALADLVFARLLDGAGQAYQGLQRLGRTAHFQAIPSVGRLLAVVALATLVAEPSVWQWAWLYLLSTAICAVYAVALVCRELGLPRWDRDVVASGFGEGFSFALSLSAQSIYNDIDKTMLARMGSLGAAGIYAAAYRVLDVAFTPVRSLMAASYARFFQAGERGLSGTLPFARRLVGVSVGYSLGMGALLYLVAPLLPLLFGEDFGPAASALRWLAVLPLLRSLHYIAADSLTGAGYQTMRSGMQVGVAVINVLLNLWLIPLYSWKGAVIASLCSDALLALGLWGGVLLLSRQPRTNARAAASPSIAASAV